MEGNLVVNTQFLHYRYSSSHHKLFSIDHYNKSLLFLHMDQHHLPVEHLHYRSKYLSYFTMKVTMTIILPVCTVLTVSSRYLALTVMCTTVAVQAAIQWEIGHQYHGSFLNPKMMLNICCLSYSDTSMIIIPCMISFDFDSGVLCLWNPKFMFAVEPAGMLQFTQLRLCHAL